MQICLPLRKKDHGMAWHGLAWLGLAWLGLHILVISLDSGFVVGVTHPYKKSLASFLPSVS